MTGAASIASIVAHAADEYLEQLSRGETPDLSAFALRYPQVASVLPQVLPVLRMFRSLAPGNEPDLVPPAAPGNLGEFQLIREIGRGGMGVVYEATQVSLGRRVALKVLPTAAGADTKQLARFQIEAQVAAALHHPHIVPIFAVGCDQGVHYYAMQLVEGRCLAAVLAERRQAEPVLSQRGSPACEPRGQIPPREAAGLAIQAAQALEHAHALGILHRDIKPANLLVDPDGRLWVTDFGLACFQGIRDLTASGDLLGTVRYMSPEQASGGRILDPRSDVYSLGATLYEMLTGRPAFDGNDRQELIRQIASSEPIAPRKLDPSIPRDLETIVCKAMAKEPERRYSTAAELALDLDRFCTDRPILARRPTPAVRLAMWSRRHRTTTAAAAVILLAATLCCSAGMALLWREHRQTLEALAKAESARASERQALRFTFASSDQITTRALERLTESKKTSPGAELDREFCRKALVYYENIASRYDHDPTMCDIVAATYHRIGFIRTILQKPLAKEALLRSIGLYETLIDGDRTAEVLRGELAITYGDLVLVESTSGHTAEAREMLEKMVAMRQALVDDFPGNTDFAISLAYHQLDLWVQMEAAGRLEESRRMWQRIARSARCALRDDWSDARICNNLAWALVSRPQGPTEHVTLGATLAAKAVRLATERGEFWNTLGAAHYRAGKWKDAAAALGESMRLRDGGDPNDWLFMAMVDYRLSKQGEAKTWYNRSLAWIKAHTNAEAQFRQLRAEAESLLAPPACERQRAIDRSSP
jgi:serine/threonine protein kinase/tetratricopeptide (TPR) repeat protein